jgi:hypothetical protein
VIGPTDQPVSDEDLATWGLYWEGEKKAEDFHLLPDNCTAVEIFRHCWKRWEHDSNGRRKAMMRGEIRDVMHLMEVSKKHRKDVFLDLMKMEEATLELLNG